MQLWAGLQEPPTSECCAWGSLDTLGCSKPLLRHNWRGMAEQPETVLDVWGSIPWLSSWSQETVFPDLLLLRATSFL